MFDRLREFFNGKRVLILGFGLEGRSTLEILKKIPCTVGISDMNLIINDDIKKYELFSGQDYLNAIDKFDIVIKAPGVVLLDRISLENKAKITSQTDLLLRFCDNIIVGITGTKGKSTTSSLIHHILTVTGKKSILIGNIGIPPLEIAGMDKLTHDTIIICEMSCHQLEYVNASPEIAVLLNIYEEHLDHYVNFEAYKAAKENIYRFQDDSDLLIYNAELDIENDAEKITVSSDDFGDIHASDLYMYIIGERIPIKNIHTKLYGRHNLLNIGAAAAVCLRLDCTMDEILDALPNFNGLPHRLESVGILNGVEYIDDSISTMPLATVASIESFPDTDTLIIGGMDRGISYDLLVDYINKSDIKNLITLPATGHKIAPLINGGAEVFLVQNMEEAINIAMKVSKTRCILSPAAASYGFYKNFEERGDHFKSLIRELMD